ncbi:MAG: murein biosynthesis integral membrane protein MurJ, partial [Gammaproteobacteria bacterium]
MSGKTEPLEPSAPHETPAPAARTGAAGRHSLLVGAGILASRIAGLVRDRVLAAYFGTGLHADVFSAGLRLPNLLQNLLGEGTLSASFIPVYSELLGRGRYDEAGRVAGAVFALLVAIAGLVSLLGIAFAPLLVTIFTPGFEGERRELMIAVTRILFPMTGVLVLSAWALGVLNSHRRFFVPYFAPVLWNAAIIGSFVLFGTRLNLDGLLIAVACGALLGGLLQLGVQLPWVLRLERRLRIGIRRNEPSFREVVKNAVPAVLGRGVVQLGGYADMLLASLLAVGAVARLRFAQTLYLLPISLFGMSVAAAALPDLARQREAHADAMRANVSAAARRVAFYVVPSFTAFVLLGDTFVAGLFETGEFGEADVAIVWMTLAAYSVGLLASTTSRVYQSAFFALRDTRTPARVAGLRVAISVLAGGLAMLQLERISIGGVDLPGGALADWTVQGLPLGPIGLALGSALGAWVEWGVLGRRLRRRIGRIGAGVGAMARMLAAALAAAAAGHAARVPLDGVHPFVAALGVALAFGVVYFGVARWLGVAEA